MGFDGKALLEALVGSALAWQLAGLIALFFSYDHINFPTPTTVPTLGPACKGSRLDRYRADRSGAMSLALAQPQLDAIADATRSDLDLLVEFQPIEPGALVQAYFGLERQLASITGKPVDLVMAGAVRNPYVRRDIEASKQLIYEA